MCGHAGAIFETSKNEPFVFRISHHPKAFDFHALSVGSNGRSSYFNPRWSREIRSVQISNRYRDFSMLTTTCATLTIRTSFVVAEVDPSAARASCAPRSRTRVSDGRSCKLRSENPATVARREGGVSTARVPKRSGGLWAALSGSARTPRAARWSRARGRTSTRPRVCRMDDEGLQGPKEASRPSKAFHTAAKPTVSAVLRRAVTSLFETA